MRPSVVFVLPATSLHGGNRIVFELAEGLQGRGYGVRVVSPEPPPAWHPVRVPCEQVPIFEPGAIPRADVAIGTFYPTLQPALASGARRVFHLCQGWEGVHREYEERLPAIDAVYRLPVPKLLVSRHLEALLAERYDCRCHFIGEFVDQDLFVPGPARGESQTLALGIVGSFGVRSKGVPEALRGLALARQAGYELAVHRASTDPFSDEERALGVTDHFWHHLPTAEMPAFYHRLDALINPPYDEEGFSLPVLEAMACGVPVAASRIRPLEVLPDDALLRFPPGEPEALVPIVAALADPERRRALAEAGFACVKEFSRDRVLDRVEAAFGAEGL